MDCLSCLSEGRRRQQKLQAGFWFGSGWETLADPSDPSHFSLPPVLHLPLWIKAWKIGLAVWKIKSDWKLNGTQSHVHSNRRSHTGWSQQPPPPLTDTAVDNYVLKHSILNRFFRWLHTQPCCRFLPALQCRSIEWRYIFILMVGGIQWAGVFCICRATLAKCSRTDPSLYTDIELRLAKLRTDSAKQPLPQRIIYQHMERCKNTADC